MSLVLFNPVSSAGRKPVVPMSLLALGAVLEAEHDYTVVDANLEEDPLECLDRAFTDVAAPVLAVTVMPGPQLEHAVPLCRELKQRRPELTVVWGGYFPTQHYEVCLKAPYVDFVVRGHGEVTFRDLVGRLARGEDPRDLPGLAFRDLETGAIKTTGMPQLPHPDEMPEFPYHRLEMESYVRKTFLGRRTLPHHSSYGCPFFCNFCAVVNMVRGGWLAQSAERTAAVAAHLVSEWGVDSVEFYDNNFFVHQARTVEFAERIRPLGIRWWGEARIDTMIKYRESTWELLRDSGLKMVFLGAESGSDETLKRMDKGGTASTEKTLEIAARMRDYGIVPEMSFVLGNPPEPEADARSTMEFIRRLKRVNPATEIILYLYTPVPLSGTLFDEAKAQGFAFPETLDEWIDPEWQETVQRRSGNLPWIRDPLRRRVRNFERVLNARYPTVTDFRMDALKRSALKLFGGLRYQLRFYGFPIELRLMQRLFSYQRPETAGF